MMLFLLVLLLATVLYQASYFLKRRRLAARSWDEILERIRPIDLCALREISDLYLNPTRDQLRLEPPVLWQMLGGLKGVHQLQSNAEAMLDLALYAERWNDAHGAAISELIRRDVARLKSAVLRIELGCLCQFGRVRAPFALLEAAGAYHLMRMRLLSYYEVTHAGLWPRLQEAV